jgi:hypothetical protein
VIGSWVLSPALRTKEKKKGRKSSCHRLDLRRKMTGAEVPEMEKSEEMWTGH